MTGAFQVRPPKGEQVADVRHGGKALPVRGLEDAVLVNREAGQVYAGVFR
ncbi:MAG: hypothetical protein JSV65_04170 [Armatimonadota bacterium]|nr:MAG: hypothetical protein JSV65_04170 [Armatimonadota bacterium]